MAITFGPQAVGINGIGDTVAGATLGSILFVGTAGVLAQDNASLFFDSTNKKLYLGGGSGGYRLTVTAVSGETIGFQVRTASAGTTVTSHMTSNDGATEWSYWTATASAVTFGSNKSSTTVTIKSISASILFDIGGTRLSIDSSGNVNIPALSVSSTVVTDGSKNLISLAYTAANTASTIMYRDSNKISALTNLVELIQSVTSAAGTTTLTVSSAKRTYITGSSSQTVKLPDATTLTLGQEFEIKNNSTSTTGVTIQDGSAATLAVMAPGSVGRFTCTSIGSTAGTWNIDISGGSSYTPTNIGSNSNITSLTLYTTRYQQENNNITVSGFLNIAASATTGSNFTISLPLGFNITNQNQCNGTLTIDNAGGTTRVAGFVLGDSTNDGAIMYITAPSTSTSNLAFIFNYQCY